MEAAIKSRVAAWVEANRVEGQPERNAEAEALQMTELVLDGHHFRRIEEAEGKLLSHFVKLKKLSLNQTSLMSLANFPPMPSLKTLELADNHINGGLEALPTTFPNLKKLELGGNHIKSIDAIAPLKQQTALEQLGLDINPLAESPDYREKVFSLLPQLKVLDCLDREGKEQAFSDDEDDEEEEEDEEEDNLLKDFYEKDFEGEGDDEEDDEEDFEPTGEEEDEEEEESDEEETENNGEAERSTAEGAGEVEMSEA